MTTASAPDQDATSTAQVHVLVFALFGASVALGSAGPDLFKHSFHVNVIALTGGGGLR